MSYLGENIPKLGFGLMRLPMLGEEVDVEQVKEMVDLFLDARFTYFDTAYGYIGGKSEKAIKEALVDRYPRESFQLATKLPAWAGPKTAEEAQQMFYTSLERTGAGYFDFYLLHNLGDTRTESFERFAEWTGEQARTHSQAMKVIAGIGVTASESKLNAAAVCRQIEITREAGLAGFALFDLDETLEKEILPALGEGK